MTWQERFRAIISVYLVLRDEQDRVLLLLRQNTGFKDGEYGLPAGHVDGDEETMQAMCREAKEEIGIDLDPHELELVHVMHRHCGDHERVDFFIEAHIKNHTPINCETNKCAALEWYALDDLPENTIDYYIQAFEAIQRGEMYSAFGWGE